MKIVAIILAGGVGSRFGSDIPKQFISLNGKPVIKWTIEAFKTHIDIDEIIVVVPNDWIDDVKKICPDAIIVEGGTTRQISSFNGIMACPKDTNYVLIHDAARPLISHSIIDRCIEKLKNGCDAVITTIKSTDTLVSTENEKVIRIENRNMIQRAQTPQCFNYKIIKRAHESTEETNSTDDSRLVLNLGIPVHIVEGNALNIKITSMADLYRAERLMQISEPKRSLNFSLENKVAVVFGGTSGIGKAISDLLSKKGAIVHSIGRDKCDIRSSDSILKLFSKIGKIDILINSAGVLIPKKIIDLKDDLISNMINTNLIGLINSCRYVARYMPFGGHIINIGSSSAYRGRSGYSLYSATKAALVNFTQALANEYEEYGIKVNVVSPPRSRTPMYMNLHPDIDPNDLYDPDKVAEIVINYCHGDETGQIIDLKINHPIKSDPIESKWT